MLFEPVGVAGGWVCIIPQPRRGVIMVEQYYGRNLNQSFHQPRRGVIMVEKLW